MHIYIYIYGVESRHMQGERRKQAYINVDKDYRAERATSTESDR